MELNAYAAALCMGAAFFGDSFEERHTHNELRRITADTYSVRTNPEPGRFADADTCA
jgi:hypothetical protein